MYHFVSTNSLWRPVEFALSKQYLTGQTTLLPQEISVQNSIIEEQQQVIQRLGILSEQVAGVLNSTTPAIIAEWSAKVQVSCSMDTGL